MRIAEGSNGEGKRGKESLEQRKWSASLGRLRVGQKDLERALRRGVLLHDDLEEARDLGVQLDCAAGRGGGGGGA